MSKTAASRKGIRGKAKTAASRKRIRGKTPKSPAGASKSGGGVRAQKRAANTESRATKTASKRAKASRKRSTAKSASNWGGAQRRRRTENANLSATVSSPRRSDKDTDLAAADIWQEACEHLFPMPEATQALTIAERLLLVPIVVPEIKVTAVSRDNSVAGQYSGVPFPRIAMLRDHKSSRTPGQAFGWCVTRSREAKNINDLGHLGGYGLMAKEHSAYRGTHYMDCVVKVSGQTVAMRRVPVTISGQELPGRNPLLKPDWVKLRGRR